MLLSRDVNDDEMVIISLLLHAASYSSICHEFADTLKKVASARSRYYIASNISVPLPRTQSQPSLHFSHYLLI